MTVTVAMSNAKINLTIKGISRTRDKLNGLIQTGIEQIIEHAQAFGDCTAAARLLSAVTNAERRGEIINHFADYSPIRLVKQAGKDNLFKASLRKPEDANYHDFNLDGVRANLWYQRPSMGNEPGVPYDLSQADTDVIRLADRIAKMAAAKNLVEKNPDGSETDRSKVKDEDRAKLLALASGLRAVAKDFATDKAQAEAATEEPEGEADEGVTTPLSNVA